MRASRKKKEFQRSRQATFALALSTHTMPSTTPTPIPPSRDSSTLSTRGWWWDARGLPASPTLAKYTTMGHLPDAFLPL